MERDYQELFEKEHLTAKMNRVYYNKLMESYHKHYRLIKYSSFGSLCFAFLFAAMAYGADLNFGLAILFFAYTVYWLLSHNPYTLVNLSVMRNRWSDLEREWEYIKPNHDDYMRLMDTRKSLEAGETNLDKALLKEAQAEVEEWRNASEDHV